MPEKKLINLLEKAKFRFAKTSKDRNPHWYTLKDTWESADDFLWCVKRIRSIGKVERFWKLEYRCFYHNNWKWWTMHSSDEDVILINKTYDWEAFNSIAFEYDNLFSDEQSIEEEKKVCSLVFPYITDRRVLDIGCGTGMILNHIDIDPDMYLGIDPSWLMIRLAKEKHPDHTFQVNKLETYHKKFDMAVSLFGSMNYVLPLYYQKVEMLCDHYFLMFYKPDYEPVTYDRSGVTINHFRPTREELEYAFPDGSIFEFNNFLCIMK